MASIKESIRALDKKITEKLKQLPETGIKDPFTLGKEVEKLRQERERLKRQKTRKTILRGRSRSRGSALGR